MFPQDLAQLCVFYAITPLHAGSGQATGAVDLPIQRERHTAWPQVQASGVKGACRDWFYRYYLANGAGGEDKKKQALELTEKIFGREEGGAGGSGQAGAIAVTDARLLAFPVRSNVAPFVWVTCPAVLTRLARDLQLTPGAPAVPIINLPQNETYLSVRGNLNTPVVLEDLAVTPPANPPDATALGEAFSRLAPQVERLLLISDQNFSFLVRTATEVQPQIKIDIDTGITKEGSLRYQELLPADSVLYSLVFFAPERVADQSELLAQVIQNHLLKAISTHIQMGGDMTLGRGLLAVRWLPGQPAQGGA